MHDLDEGSRTRPPAGPLGEWMSGDGSARPPRSDGWLGEAEVEDGLGVFVAAATGVGTPSGSPSGEERPEGGRRSWWPLAVPPQFRPPPVGVAFGAAAAVVLVTLALVVVLGAGGPGEDPTIPVAGSRVGGDDPGEGTGVDGGPAADTSPNDGRADAAGSVDAAAVVGGPRPDAQTLLVHVAGAVVTPGVHRLPSGARVYEAIAAAGGSLPEADLDRLNLAAPLSDGAQIHVLQRGTPGGGSAGVGTGSAAGPSGGGGGNGPVSLSTADQGALDALPGVGPSTAAAIIAHREANGPFGSVEELLEVRGIGEAKLEGLRDLVVP